jgi:hypothetical protein
MSDVSRYFALELPQGSDSVASNAGLAQINNFFDNMDAELFAVSNTGVAGYYVGLWTASNSPSLSSSATVSNSALTWTNVFSTSGTPSPSFNTSTGMIQFATAGFYRLSYHLIITGMSAVTEGYFKVGLKESATAAFVTRTAKQSAMETYLGETHVHGSVLLEAHATTGDVNLASNYNVTAIQENSSVAAATLGGSSSWVALEYVRAP